jgi:cytochrome c biogenesis factor
MLAGLMQGRNPMPDLAALFQGRNPFEDLYLVLEDVVPNVKQPQKSQVTLLILVNPLVGFMWLGGFLVGLGGAITLLPARKKQRVVAVAPETSRFVPEEASA